jgi:hypothetical protein
MGKKIVPRVLSKLGKLFGFIHSDDKTVSPYGVLPVYVELIRAVWADDGDRPLLF